MAIIPMNSPDGMGMEGFLNKPERVIALPETILPDELMDAYRSMKDLAVVEIAGRDSVAAAIDVVNKEGFTDLLPTYAYTGTEHGEWSTVQDAVRRLAQRLPVVRVHPLLVIGSPRFWQSLNGRFAQALSDRYGAFSPCVGCHLYLHSVRIPLAAALGNRPIIAGERERHDSGVKINQIGEALGRYRALAEGFNIRLHLPLRHISRGDQIEAILGCAWDEGKSQLKCVLSGNYRDPDGNVIVEADQAVAYLENFALPLTRTVIDGYLNGEVPDHLELARRLLTTDAGMTA
jgi:hypothetical protein